MALNSSPSQLQLSLGQLVNIWNAVRHISVGSTASSSVHETKESHDTTHGRKTSGQSHQTKLNLPSCVALLRDFNIEPVIFLPGQNVPKSSHWQESHKSANTFYENKYGASPGYDGETHRRVSEVCYAVFGSKHQLNHLKVHDVIYQQVRGFKTKRQPVTGIQGTSRPILGRIDLIKMPVTKMMDSGSSVDKKDIADLGRENIAKIVREAKLSPQQEADLKIAFAEGYHADWVQYMRTLGSGKFDDLTKMAFAEGYRKASKPQMGKQPAINTIAKFMSAMVSLVVMCCIIGLVYTSLSGVRRVQLFSGEQFEVNPEKVTVTFDDVRGADEAKSELQNIVDFLKHPQKYTELGAKLPNGCLLVGPPGVGKTLLARAVAGEAGVPFFQASGAEFDEVFVGTGAKRIRQLFAAAKARAPCVIFIDEIDSVGGKRTNSEMHPYANQTINQLLTEMDGFQANEGVVVLGATNKRENLDKALLRPGRFDVEVTINAPDLKGRQEILQLYLPKIKCDKDINILTIAKGTTGCTGADLNNIVNHAAMKAAVDGKTSVSMNDIEHAIDKVLMGPQKKRVVEQSVNVNTAYHEAGHALVAFYSKATHQHLHKITILPRGPSLGMTHFTLEEKREFQYTKEDMLHDMDVAMGGRIAEEMMNGMDGVTTGASSDMLRATQIATEMVKMHGFTEKLGLRVYPSTSDNAISPKVQEEIDEEIKRLLKESYERARKLLLAHRNELKSLAEALLEHEVLSADEARIVIEGGKLEKIAHAPSL